jgi:hypothetical protein
MKLIKLCVTLLILVFAPLCSAKILTLYDQPKSDAKSIGTIDSEVGMIPIFTPKDSAWIKVADPKNGNVGWIKSADLDMKGTNGFSFSQKMISTGKGPQSYVIQFGIPQTLTPEQSQAFIKRIKEQTQSIQKDTQKMMQDMFKSINQMQTQFPVIMPVIVMPNADVPAAKNNSETATPSKSNP